MHGRLIMTLSLILVLSGCGNKIHMPNFILETPTPVPAAATKTPTPVAQNTSTPTPTVTPAPRMIGSKNGSAGSITLTNATGQRFRQIYLKSPNGEGWGRNLIPAESSIHTGEVFELYYPSGSEQFNFLFRDTSGVTYEMDGVKVGDIDTGVLQYDQTQQDIYLTYLSLESQMEGKVVGYSGAGSAPEETTQGSNSYDNTYYDYEETYYESDWDVEEGEQSGSETGENTQESTGETGESSGETTGETGETTGETGETTGETGEGTGETGESTENTGEAQGGEEAPFPITNEDYYETGEGGY